VRYRCILLSLGGLDPTALGRLGLNPSCPAFEVSWKSLGKLNNSLSQTKKLVKEIFPKKIYLLVISIFILQFLLLFILLVETIQYFRLYLSQIMGLLAEKMAKIITLMGKFSF